MPLALVFVIVGGMMQGSFAMPMKKTAGWAWENTWLVWSVTSLVVVPLALAWVTVGGLWEVYSGVGLDQILLAGGFGLVWGFSAVLFGQGVARVGMALAFGIIIGMSSVLGALIPLFSLHADQLLTRTGYLTLCGLALQTLGVAACALAGRLREKGTSEGREGSMKIGLLICVLSGLMAPMVNVGLAYASDIVAAAERLGAEPADAVNAVWPLLFGAGFLANVVYCVYLLNKNSTWPAYVRVRPLANLGWSTMMGLLWIGGFILYGYASQALGSLGVVLGWPVMMSSMVLTGNAWGAVTGEWKGSAGSAKAWIVVGVLLLIAGIGVIGMAGRSAGGAG